MKIVIMGDVHGNFKELNAWLKANEPDVLIICGDFGYWPTHYDFKKCIDAGTAQIYWCDGNHEDYGAMRGWSKEVPHWMAEQVFHMPRGSTLKCGKHKFLFMGGAESIDKGYRIKDKTWFEEETISDDDMARLPDTEIDFVISHTAPTFIKTGMGMIDGPWGEGTIFPKGSVFEEDKWGQSARQLETVFEKYKPKGWFFGHFHMEHTSFQGGCLFTGLNMFNNGGCTYELES